MKKILMMIGTACLTLAMMAACSKKSDADFSRAENTTPAELMETEWFSDKFAVWNNYRIYPDGTFFNRATKVWFSGSVDAGTIKAGNGLYFGPKRFVSNMVTSGTSGGGCRTNNAVYIEGYPAFQGSKVILHPTYKRVRSKSVCSTSDDFDRDEKAGTEEYTWQLGSESDPDGYQYYTLTLTDKNGNSAVFYRRK